jgi:hypothetical protein
MPLNDFMSIHAWFLGNEPLEALAKASTTIAEFHHFPDRFPLLVQNHVTRIAVEMHSSFNKEEVSTESRDVIDSLWTLLPSRRKCAL